MPSIEILAVDQSHPVGVGDLPFAVAIDAACESHRVPSRFQSDFERVSGILYHLGNADLKHDRKGRIFFAYKLLSLESKRGESSVFEFAPEYRAQAQVFFERLMSATPSRQLIFTSDWQFGPEWTKHKNALSLHEYWRLHDLRQIELNALYPIVDDRER